LTGVRWNLNVILYAFSLWSGMLSISLCIYLPVVLFPSRVVYSIHLPISSLGCWFFGTLAFITSLYSGY
jgi:hypothetical protein